ncbi:hypothetical protein BO221_00070 [Archangium sp. Cb G35]|uniref:hypothetical protein n=1 Tax=Archangium sp. Cb G35 TaxID=1920190 RepID=UPI000936DB7C|nr:hypothetical protein [Archangium sp. Cb G35]OJT26484.1 hypothetical protein BO221_00070 [Archangium sp. Cb G35]
MPRRSIPALVLSALLLPVSALAGSVFLNGVRIDGVTNQKFEKVASVRIDDKGNVHIDAPAYAVKLVNAPAAPAPVAAAPAPAPAPVAPATPPPAPATAAPAPAPAVAAPAPAPAPVDTAPARITRRYWLVTEQPVVGMAEYDVDLYVNSRWVRKLRSAEDQVIAEITRELQPGKNTLLMIARKVAAGSRRSESPQHVFKVIIGEGNEGGGNVMIDNPLIRYQRTAAETEDLSEEFTLITR